MVYAESESMALRRLRVAFKRKDWQMFDYSLIRAIDFLQSGTPSDYAKDWYDLLDQMKADAAPEELTQKYTNILETFLKPPISQITVEPEKVAPVVIQPKTTKPEKIPTPDIPLVIFIGSKFMPEHSRIIKKLHYNLLKLSSPVYFSQ